MENLKIRYFLKSSAKAISERIEPELIYAEISMGQYHIVNGAKKYKKIQFSLQTYIKPENFGVVKNLRGKLNYVYDRNVISNKENYNKNFRDKKSHFEKMISAIFVKLEEDKTTLTLDELKKNLIILAKKPSNEIKKYPIIPFIEKHIENLENLIDTGNKKEIRVKTIDSYRSLIPWIKRYQDVKGELFLNNLTDEIYDDFWRIAQDIAKGKIKIESFKRKPQKNGFSKSTIKLRQTYFLLICQAALKKDIKMALDPSDSDHIISTKSENPSEKTVSYLSELEIIKVINFNIPKATSDKERWINKEKNMKLAKDYILISSFTGMRIQSMIEACGREIKHHSDKKYNFWYIHTKQIKTGTECLTPLSETAFSIIQKNNYLFPNFVDSRLKLTNLNNNIRKVLASVGIDKSHLFSTKNFRNTYITNLALLGVGERVVELVTHPDKKYTTKSSHTYNQMIPLDKAKEFMKNMAKVEESDTLFYFTLSK